MASTIKIKNSSTASAIPTSSDLVQGELAVNVTDKRLFTENASGTVVELCTNPSVLTVTAGATIQGLTVGKGAGAVSTNTAVGASALAANTTGDTSTAVGYQALQSSQGGASNTALGVQALRLNTSGNNNLASGRGALYANTSGSSNVACGQDALAQNTTASNNTAVGYQAGYTNSTGTANTLLGKDAGYSATGSQNTFAGMASGYSTTGSGNTFVGYTAGYNVSSGAKNTIIGQYNGNQGGLDIRTSSNYIVLSDGDGNPRGIFDSSGNLLVGTTSLTAYGKVSVAFNGSAYNGASYNDTNNTTGAGFIYFLANGTTIGSINRVGSGSTISYATSSDYRLKENIQPMTGALSVVQALKPCTYTWKVDGSDGQGFIAHELAEVCPDAVVGEKDAVNEDGSIKAQGIDTSFLVATLTAAIQELNAKVDAQAAEIAALKGQA